MREIEVRDEYVKKRLLNREDNGDFVIFNYSKACEYGAFWDEVTRASRGIIFNKKTGEVVARPFQKFFSLTQTEETRLENLPAHLPCQVFEKMDGSLGILWRGPDGPAIATRGSFRSKQARWATDFLRSRFDLKDLPDHLTLLFEIVYPGNVIVKNYGSLEDLVLLAAIDRFTGAELDFEGVKELGRRFGFTVVQRYEAADLQWCLRSAEKLPWSEEGYVVLFSNGFRVKIKGHEYLAISRQVSRYSAVAVWESMKDGRVTFVYQEKDHWFVKDRLETDTRRLETMYADLKRKFEEVFQGFSELRGDRRFFAAAASQHEHAPALFALLDGNLSKLDHYILKQMRPQVHLMHQPDPE